MKLKEKLTSHVAVCPRCAKKLRVPVKPGKRLRVCCSGCELEFDISFKSPLLEIFQFNPSLSLKENGLMSIKRYAALPDQVRRRVMLLFLFTGLLLFSILAAVVFLSLRSFV